MNPSDFITLLDILKFSAGNECEDMGVFATAKTHISSFFRNYLLRVARFDIIVAELFGQSLAPPPTTIENFEHLKAGQIVNKPWGVVFKGLSSDNETMVTKFFEIDFLGRFPSESIKQVLSLVNNCFVNTLQEKKLLRDHLNWWLTVSLKPRSELNQKKTPKSEDSEVLRMEDPKTSQTVNLSFVCTRIVQYVLHEPSILLASTLIGYSLIKLYYWYH
ncbi:hypothetical protein L1887_35522 [Cichorium endivia]|nr:hypothetical protein L1887_35522 [Cichorium endivia]